MAGPRGGPLLGAIARGQRLSPDGLFLSPPWFDSQYETGRGDRIRLAVLRDQAGRPARVVPITRTQLDLRLNFKLLKWNIPLRVAEILGDPPAARMIRTNTIYCYHLIDNIDDVVRSDALARRRGFLLALTSGSRPPSGAGSCCMSARRALVTSSSCRRVSRATWRGSNSKHRNNLKRRARILRGLTGRALEELRRVTTREDVPEFLRLAGESWPATRGRTPTSPRIDQISESPTWQRDLADLADRGVLRGYLLMCGPTPSRFRLGLQGYGCYHFQMTGYDPAFAQLSPGTVATYLIIEDLFRHDPPNRLSFGYGNQEYKRQSRPSSPSRLPVSSFSERPPETGRTGWPTPATVDWSMQATSAFFVP